jgi:hypothetical protein
VKIPNQIAELMREAHAALRAEPTTHVEAIAKRVGGIPLFGNIFGGTLVMLLDGEVVEVPDDPDGPPTPASPESVSFGLVAGSRRYPWLAELIPTRPSDALDCPTCGGTGEIAFNDARGERVSAWCGACHALGWQVGGGKAVQQ